MEAGPLRIFVGYDERERLAYHVLSHSIARRASAPVSIQPIMLSQLGGLYRRSRGPTESTQFSMTRFLVPHLADYRGWVVFMDCDMLCLTDLVRLTDVIEQQADKALLVCQHDYVPKTESKFLGNRQTAYPRKNWSSFMLMNAARCRALTPDYVNSATGLQLHRFQWLDDKEIGSIPLDFNWLVGEYEKKPDARVLHYTLGGPWFSDYASSDHADLWRAELAHMMGS